METLLQNKTSFAKDIASVEQRSDELKLCREEREKFLKELQKVRDEMTARRKAQLKAINANLKQTITEYHIYIKYDDEGITDEFESFLQEELHGTYFPDNMIKMFCCKITPAKLAELRSK